MLARAFYAGDFEGVLQQMRAYLAGIPYHLGSRDERGFKTTFYLSFELLSIKIVTEFKTATGRIDTVVRARNAVYIMEFRYERNASETLVQIDDRRHPAPFSADGRRFVWVGVNFSPEQQAIDEWVIADAWTGVAGAPRSYILAGWRTN